MENSKTWYQAQAWVNTNPVIPAQAGIQYVNPIRRINIQDASHYSRTGFRLAPE